MTLLGRNVQVDENVRRHHIAAHVAIHIDIQVVFFLCHKTTFHRGRCKNGVAINRTILNNHNPVVSPSLLDRQAVLLIALAEHEHLHGETATGVFTRSKIFVVTFQEVAELGMMSWLFHHPSRMALSHDRRRNRVACVSFSSPNIGINRNEQSVSLVTIKRHEGTPSGQMTELIEPPKIEHSETLKLLANERNHNR